MKKVLYLLVIQCLLSSCASLIKQKDLRVQDIEFASFKSYVRDNQFNKFKERLGMRKVTPQASLQLLNIATGDNNFHLVRTSYHCQPKFVSLILKNEGKLSSRHLGGILANQCLASLKAVEKQLSPAIIADATQKYYIQTMNEKKLLKLIKPIMKILKLKKNQGLPETTIAKSNISKAAIRYDKKLKDLKFSKTPEGIEQSDANQICGLKEMSNKYKSHIKEEREKAKISGYVNVINLKKWGDYAYTYDKKTTTRAKAYKSKYKEKFDFKRCK
jgi:hypothetical protein